MPRWPSQTIKTPAERFWQKVDKAGPDECWLWRGGQKNPGRKRSPSSIAKGRYGIFSIDTQNKRMITAHRAAWIIANGREPRPSEDVCHTCDNRLCVNPAHLWVGTRKQNMADCKAKGRVRHGIGGVRCELTGMFLPREH